jgi:hypothetical protein
MGQIKALDSDKTLKGRLVIALHTGSERDGRRYFAVRLMTLESSPEPSPESRFDYGFIN